jgi:hypothetical protein
VGKKGKSLEDLEESVFWIGGIFRSFWVFLEEN